MVGLVISIFCLPSLFMVYLQLAQWQQQQFMEEEMEGTTLLTISIPKADLHWYKTDKEAIVDGKLFDVKDSYQDGDLVFLTGLFDADETDLKNKIQYLSKAEEEEKENSALAQQYFNIQLFPLPQYINCPPPYVWINSLFPCINDTRLRSIPLSVVAPPPEA